MSLLGKNVQPKYYWNQTKECNGLDAPEPIVEVLEVFIYDGATYCLSMLDNGDIIRFEPVAIRLIHN